MSLDFPKRSDLKIIERIILSPSGDRDELYFICSQCVSIQTIIEIISFSCKS